jgi:hypothetical protein
MMDKAEARRVLSEHLESYRARSYRELASQIDEVDTREFLAPSGNLYQVEIQVLWDDQPGGNLRVIGSIDDGGWSAFRPVTDDFIMAPDGRFVGEESS